MSEAIMNCPKCDADISDSYLEYDPSVGVLQGGYYCEACDMPVDDDESSFEDDWRSSSQLTLDNERHKRAMEASNV